MVSIDPGRVTVSGPKGELRQVVFEELDDRDPDWRSHLQVVED